MYPLIDPHDEGMLDVGDGNLVHWDVAGNPAGLPAVVVHGGPGSGCTPGTRRYFDPDRYRIVQFDQRNCGRSTPHASSLDADLRHNTTDHLVADMERLREHLGIDRWLLFGGSWGSTLILAYAERHPHHVAGIVIDGVTSTRRREINWLYEGVGRFFPAQWAAFRDFAGADDGDVVAAYARLMNSPDPAVRAATAEAWCTWEDAVISLEPNGVPDAYSGRPDDAKQAMVRICTHYAAHAAWLEEGALLRDADRLAGIRGVLLHGRFDISSPLETAWHLTQRWPDAELTVVEDSGHTGSDTMRTLIRAALDSFVTS
ncbi:prolyl aminopeptidase [Dactylosporangium siamense]|uniref:Proline iminopeptidase n=1 Tax=Dactylosporangium siamense TaxID=685454 RepID=A0A919PPV6_9ACTN|nr:prolyl aminopeptidase [Dactylosporangium siamense]GIG48526.1 proline iminopeptidase [Dactylosporangium siamense]